MNTETEIPPGPFSLQMLPRLSLEILCMATRTLLKSFTQSPTTAPSNLQFGEEVLVTCRARIEGHDDDGNKIESDHLFELPLTLVGISPTSGERHFRIAQRVIEVDLLGKTHRVCWSAPDYNGSLIWFAMDDLPSGHFWDSFCDVDGTRKKIPMVYRSHNSLRIPDHPEKATDIVPMC